MEELICPVCANANPIDEVDLRFPTCGRCHFELAGVRPTAARVAVAAEPDAAPQVLDPPRPDAVPAAANTAAGLSCVACGEVSSDPDVCSYCFHPRAAATRSTAGGLAFTWGAVSAREDSEVLIGRDNPALPELSGFPNVSRRHAELRLRAGELVITDLQSTNGTFVNDEKLQPGQPRAIRPGDVVRLGSQLSAEVKPAGGIEP